MQLKPLLSRVMYEVVAAETKTEAGIILSPGLLDDNNNPVVGKVLDIGPDCTKVQIGSTILIDRGVSSRFIEGFGDKQVIRFFVEEKFVIAVGT